VNGQGASWLNRSQFKLQKTSQRLHDNRPRAVLTSVPITLAYCSSAEVAGQSEGRQVSTGGRPDGPPAAQLMLKSEQTPPRAGASLMKQVGRSLSFLLGFSSSGLARLRVRDVSRDVTRPSTNAARQQSIKQLNLPRPMGLGGDGQGRRDMSTSWQGENQGRGTFLCWLRHSRPSHLVAKGRVSLVSLE
jgi:hypothetical protein